MKRSRRSLAFLALALPLALACSARGPVDRSLDAAHATNRTIGETGHDAIDAPKDPKGSAVDIATAPFRLVGRLANALFGP